MSKFINASNIEHAVVALAVQALFGAAFQFAGLGLWGWLIGGAFGTALFVGRECSQWEGARGGAKLFKGYEAILDFPHWSLDAKMDLLCPAAVNTAVSAAALYLLLSRAA